MTAYLISLDGHDHIPLDRVLVVVGRHNQCDVRVDSHRVSRRHCCLALDRDGVLVRDLGSTNGTWINGRRVDVGFLLPGDVLAIAQARFRLEVRAAESPARADSPGPRGVDPTGVLSLRDAQAGAPSPSEGTGDESPTRMAR